MRRRASGMQISNVLEELPIGMFAIDSQDILTICNWCIDDATNSSRCFGCPTLQINVFVVLPTLIPKFGKVSS